MCPLRSPSQGPASPASVLCPPQHLAAHLWRHSEALEALENGLKSSRRLENFCRDFELQKVCYLPLNTFLLRPLHRLMHYKQVLERLCKYHSPNHVDFRDCRGECHRNLASPLPQRMGALFPHPLPQDPHQGSWVPRNLEKVPSQVPHSTPCSAITLPWIDRGRWQVTDAAKPWLQLRVHTSPVSPLHAQRPRAECRGN